MCLNFHTYPTRNSGLAQTASITREYTPRASSQLRRAMATGQGLGEVLAREEEEEERCWGFARGPELGRICQRDEVATKRRYRDAHSPRVLGRQ